MKLAGILLLFIASLIKTTALSAGVISIDTAFHYDTGRYMSERLLGDRTGYQRERERYHQIRNFDAWHHNQGGGVLDPRFRGFFYTGVCGANGPCNFNDYRSSYDGSSNRFAPPTSNSASESVSLPQFDTSLGTLTGVNISLNATYSHLVYGNALDILQDAQYENYYINYPFGLAYIAEARNHTSTSLSHASVGMLLSIGDNPYGRQTTGAFSNIGSLGCDNTRQYITTNPAGHLMPYGANTPPYIPVSANNNERFNPRGFGITGAAGTIYSNNLYASYLAYCEYEQRQQGIIDYSTAIDPSNLDDWLASERSAPEMNLNVYTTLGYVQCDYGGSYYFWSAGPQSDFCRARNTLSLSGLVRVEFEYTEAPVEVPEGPVWPLLLMGLIGMTAIRRSIQP